MRDENGKPRPVEIQGREAKYDQAPDLLQRGHWVCLNIEPSCSWPVWPQSLDFLGHKIWIIPLTLEDHPGVAIRRPPEMKTEEAERLLYRFLSVLAWQNNCGITVAYRSGGSLPSMVGLNKKYGFSLRKLFDFTEILYPQDDDALIALALMREARGLNHIAYAFLSFWRVLELAFPEARERVTWMSKVLPKLSGSDVQAALKSIADAGIQDVGRHLYESGRCAIAHATGKPIVNPDDPRDAERLFLELPLVREMAVRAIEDRFGILTQSAEFDLHLYELRGWKRVLGRGLI
ncbi:methylamine utilization protein MauJ, partial [Methylobacterium gnaphalii]